MLGVATTNLIAMETGSSLVVVFAAEAGYTATPNERFTNDTTIRWSSYPASPTNLSAYNAAAMARTGGTNTPLPDVNYSTNSAVLDNYAATSGTVLATDKPTVFAKALFQTSLTTPGNANNQAAVGELVTYTVTATIPQGTAPGMQIIDTLQAGLAFVDVTDVTVSPNVNLEHEIGLGSNAANVTVAPPGRVITFSPGDVVNTNSDGSISTIVITYRAVVLDEMGNQAGTTLTNSAVFSCATCATTNAYAAAITVVEPALGVRELVSTNASTYDTAVSGIQAGQPVYFQVAITNGTGTTAYDLWLSNALPARFHQGTVVSVTPAGNVWTNGIAATGSLETGLFEFTGTVLGVATTNLIAMETGSSLVVVFAAEAGYTATPNERFTNDTTIRWSSYPASPTNLSAYNAAAMARTGGTNTPLPDVNYSTNNAVLDNYAATSGTVLATDKPTVFAKALFQTSLTTPGNANNQAAVGELVTYTVTATIPQGTAPGMQIIDTLQAGLAFVDVTDVTVSPNVNLEHEIGLGSNAANVTVAPPGRVITFSPGDVVNTNSDGSISTIVITYRAVVLDEMGNQAGTTLTNSAVFSCATCATTNAYAPAITVVEPALGVRELVSTNGSTYGAAVSGIQAGQPVYFQVTITNGTGTTAYDLWLSNALPSRFHQGTVVSVTPAGNVWTNGIAAMGALETGLFEFTGTVLGVATTNLIAMETGSSLVVVFAAEAGYTATPNERFTNDTTIRWSSYPASPTNLSAYNAAAMARTGGTNTPPPDVNYSTNSAVLDNYAATSGTVLATDKPTVFAKALFQTSLTTPGNANNQAAVGELVTYTVTATIPQGTAPGMQIIDTLQAGLAFVDVTDVTVSPNVNLEHEIGLGSNAANVTVAPPGRVITFSPGDVVNTNSDGSISTIVITYRAVVLDEMGNQAGTTLTNSAVFSCATCATTNAYAAAITVVEPALGVRELVSTNASTYDTAVSGIQAGQPVYFQVTITNGTGTTAYDLWLSNALPSRFHQGTVVSVTPAGNVWTNGIAAAGALETGLFEFTGTILGVATTNLIAMETGSSLVVVFAAEAVYTATPNERFTNDTTIRWSSYPASPTNLSAYNAAAMARTGGTNTPPPDVNYSTNNAVLDNYAATSGTVLATDKPTVFAKALFQTSLTTPGNANNQAAVGELVTYTVTATIPQGTAPGMQIIDTLQAGLAFVDVTDVTVSPNVSLEHEIGLGSNAANVTVAPPGRVITFSPGDVVNTNSDGSVSTIIITYRAVVLDEMGNQAGTTLTNSAVFSCATCATTNAYAPAITVVEPALGVRELVSTNASTYDTAVSGIQAGQPVYFQVTITNGTGTTAYDLWLSNALPARFHQGTVVSVTPAGNVWTNGIAATGSLETGLFEFTGTILGVATTNLIAMETGSSLVVVFAAEAGYTATPNERFTNDTTIRWSSYPASPTNLSAYNAAAMARTGGTNTPPPDVNYSTNSAVLDNYAATSGTVLATDKPTVFAKALFQTSLTTPGNANNQASVGELVTYTVTATIPQGTAPGMQIIDTLQAGLAFVDVTDVTVSPNVSLEHEIGLGSNAANVTVAPPGRVITFSPGDVVNTNSDGSVSTIVITYRAVVLDEMGNQTGTTLTNSAVFSCATCATTNAFAPAITVVEPALGVRELVSTNASTYDTAVSGIQAGQPVYFQVTITNGTGTTAYDLWLSNALPARFHQGTVVSVTPAGNVWTNGIAATGSLETGLFEFTGTILGVATPNLIAMETGSSLVVVFAAEAGYTATPNERFTNDTTIRWSSYPASPTNLSAYNAAAMARTGGTNTPPPDVNYSTNNAVLDNYAATSGTVLATDKPTVFAKALFQTSLTTPGNANNQASVGELVTYTVLATIPQGTAPGMQIIDTLQAGLAFVDVTDVTVSPNVNLEHEIGLGSNAANVTVAPPGRVITFSPGDVVNTNSDGSISTIVITYRAVVLDEMGNQAGTTLTNSAVFSCTTCATTNAYAPAITVVEPALGVRELVSTNASTYDTAVSGIQAGQPVYFQVTITNGTGTTAYDLWLSNALPARFHQGTVVSVTPAGNVWTNGIAATGSLETGLFEFTGTILGVATPNLIAMETGSSLVVVFAAEAGYAATPNERFTNDTTIRWSSYPASPTNLSAYNAAAMARTGGTNTPLPDVNYSTNNAVLDNYAATSGTVLATDKPTVFAKALFQTSLTTPGNANNQAAVGELVTYTVTATIPQGTAPGMQIIDTLQAGLAFVDVTDVTVSPNVNLEHEIGLGSNAANVTVAPPGRVITFSPGDVVNTNSDGSISTIVITYRAVVLDEMGNQAGTTLTNSAVFSCATCATTNAYAPAITVVEPALGVRELVSTNASTYDTAMSGIQAGQPVYFQVTITNGTGTTAYDLWLSNALPARFQNGAVVSVTPAGNVWTNGIAATGSLETGLFEFTGTILGVATPNLIAMETGSSLVVVFAAEAGYTATPNERFTNDTTIRWSSYPASPTNLSAYNAAAMARTGGTNTPPPDVNYSTNNAVLDNYAATSGTVLATDKPTVFAKALFQTSLTTPGNANNQAAVGELVTYTVTATIPQGTAPGMQIIDTLQAGLAFVDVTDVTVSPNVNLEHEIGLGSNAANVTVAPPGRVITFSPGDVVNTNSDGSVSTIVITYRAVVLDEMGNQAGTTLTNSAVFSCATCATTNAYAPAITVVEPALGVRELVSTNASTYDTAVNGIQAGQPVYFQVAITNGTGTTAYDLWLSNALPARFHQGTVVSVTPAGNVWTNGIAATGSLETGLFEFTGTVLGVATTNLIAMETGSSLVVVFAAEAGYTATPNERFTNDTTIRWSSYPASPTNLSAYNAAAMARTGGTNTPPPDVNYSTNSAVLDNYAAASGTVLATDKPTVFAKALFQTSLTTPGNANNQAAVGELVTYTVTATIPQGTAPGMQIIDTLQAGLAFVDVTDVTVSPNVNLEHEIGLGSNAANVTVAPPGRVITFSPGNVVNANTDNSAATVVITYRAVVLDEMGNQAGTTLTNSAVFSCATCATTNAYAAAITVVEPALGVRELVSTNASTYDTAVSGIQAGQPVYFQVTITNGTGTTAYDLWLSNALPARFHQGTVVSVTPAGNIWTNGIAATGALETGLFEFTGTVLGVATTNLIAMETGSSLVVVFAAEAGYTATPNERFTNDTTIRWSSYPASPTNLSAYNAAAMARTGGTNTPPPDVNYSTNSAVLDNYAATSGTVLATDKPTVFAKALFQTSLTTPGNANNQAAVGELVTYTVTATIPQGTAPGMQIIDTLQAGLAFVDVTDVTVSPNVNLEHEIGLGSNAANVTVAPPGRVITFSPGDVVNTNSDGSISTIVITYRAVVLDEMGNQAGTTLTNSAVFSCATCATTNAFAPAITVVEPALGVRELVSTNASTYDTAVSGIQAGQPVYFQVTITNGTGTTAYDLWLSNALPARFHQGTVVSVTPAGNVWTNGIAATGSLETGLFEFTGTVLGVATTNLIAMETGSSLVVVFAAEAVYTATPNERFTNDTTIRWSSYPASPTNLSAYNAAAMARTGGTNTPLPDVNYSTNNAVLDNYAATSGTVLATDKPTVFAKALFQTSLTTPGNANNQASVGELVTYTVTATIPQGTAPGMQIIDTLQAGLAFVDVTDVTVSPNVNLEHEIGLGSNAANVTVAPPGRVITFSPGDVVNTNSDGSISTIVITYRAVVLDEMGNQAGTTLTNSAVFSCATCATTNAYAPAITVVEPALGVRELVSTNASTYDTAVSGIQAGQPVYFQVTITNGTGTTAYDLWLSNALPARFQNGAVVSVTPAGNVWTNGIAATGSLETGLFEFTGTILGVATPNLIAMETGSSLVVVFAAEAGYTATPNERFTNDTTIRWSSYPASPTNLSAYNAAAMARTGGTNTPPPDVNYSTNNAVLDNYAATSGTVLATDKPTVFAKALFQTSLTTPGNANNQAAVGELVTYTVTATVPQGTTPALQIIDTLQAGLAFVDVTGVALSPNVSLEHEIGTGSNAANVSVAPPGRVITFSPGNVVNANTDNSAATVVITYRAVVLDEMGNQTGTTLTNAAVFSCATCATTNAYAPAITVVEPALGVRELVSTDNSSYSGSVSNIQAAQTVYFQITVTNGTGTTAYDLWLSNSLPAGFQNGAVLSATAAGNVWTNGIAAAGALETGLFEFTGSVLGVATTNLIAMETNSSLVVVFSATPATTVVPNERFTNNTTIRWSSYPASPTNLSAYNAAAMARTGGTSAPLPDENYSTNSAVLDNYAAASGTVLVSERAAAFAKAFIQTSLTTPGNDNSQASVGELVTYTVTATVPQGTTPALQIIDTLQAGLAFVDVTGVALSPNVSLEHEIGTGSNAANVSVAPPGRVITFSPGNVVNANTDNSAATVVITYRAVVLDEMGNQTGTTLTNAAVFSCATCATTNAYAPAITVVEPALGVRELVSTDNSSYGGSVSNIQAAQPVYFLITITNGTGTTAYDLWLSNALPAGFQDGAVVSVTPAGDVWTNGIAASGALETGLFEFTGSILGVATTNLIAMETNSSLVVVFSATPATTVVPNERFTNNTTIRWSSYPASPTNLSAYNSAAMARTGGTSAPLPDENYSTNSAVLDNYAAASGTVGVGAGLPVLSKGIVAADEPGVSGNSGVNGTNATIGELVTYRIAVSLPEGTTSGLVVTDVIPAGMVYASNSVAVQAQHPDPVNLHASHFGAGTQVFGGSGESVVAVTPAAATNGAIAFTFGSITVTPDGNVSNNTFSFTYQAVVLDKGANAGLAGGQTLMTNEMVWTTGLASGSGLVDPSGNVVAVVEPRLSFVQSVMTRQTPGATSAYLGDAVSYTFRIAHAGDTLSSAFDVAFSDPLPGAIGASLSNPLTMANVIVTNASGSDLSSQLEIAGGVLRTKAGMEPTLLRNDAITLVVTGVLSSASAFGGSYTNPAAITYSTRPGDYSLAGGFNPNPAAVTDQERTYSAANSTVITTLGHTISGFVYHDADNDGVKDAGETPLSGVTVTLTGTDYNGLSVSLSTNTDGAGAYSFAYLAPGTYTLARTTTPAAYLDGKEAAGTSYGGTVDNTINSHMISVVTIAPEGAPSGANYNFGLVLPNRLEGLVWADLDRNDLLGGGDYGITNVIVTLGGTDDRGATVSAATGTGTNGTYAFENLRPGVYTLTETQPALYGNGHTFPGTVDSATNGTAGADQITVIDLAWAQGKSGVHYDFSEYPGRIGNLVFLDANNNGLADAGEAGINAVEVQLWSVGTGEGGTDQLAASTNTATLSGTAGSYLFHVLPGSYFIKIASAPSIAPMSSSRTGTGDNENHGTQSGGVARAPAVAMAAGQTDVTQDFGFVDPGTLVALGNRVFNDINGDGILNGLDDGIAGVRVELYTNGQTAGVSTPLAATTTAGTGHYYFDALLPGGYFIHVPASEFASGKPLEGFLSSRGVLSGDNRDKGLDGLAPATTGTSSGLLTLATNTAPAGETDTTGYAGSVPDASADFTIDLGFVAPGAQSAIGNFVFHDVNNNGQYDAGLGETGINGVSVQLWSAGTGPEGADELIASGATDSQGAYLFATVPGTYYVKVPTPPAAAPRSSSTTGVLNNENHGAQTGGDGGPVAAASVVLAAGATNLSQDFGFASPAPQISCLAPVTVSCAGSVPAPATDLAAFVLQGGSASGSCGPVTVTWTGDTTNSKTCANRFTITRAYRADDALCGTYATCEQTITVNDTTAPAFTSFPANASLVSTNWDQTGTNYTGVPAAEDGCGSVTITYSDTGSCQDAFITRTWQATDACGNTVTSNQTIVLDGFTGTIASWVLDLPLKRAFMTYVNPHTLASIQAITNNNALMTGTAYDANGLVLSNGIPVTTGSRADLPAGTTKLVVLAVKVIADQPAIFNAMVQDQCGMGKSFDPVLATLTATGAEPVRETYQEVPAAEHYVRIENGAPGLDWVILLVNGYEHRFQGLSNKQVLVLDVAAETVEGNNNTFTIIGQGAAGSTMTLMIGDAPDLKSGETLQVLQGEDPAGRAGASWGSKTGASAYENPAPISTTNAVLAMPYPSGIRVSGLRGVTSRVRVTLAGLTHGAPGNLSVLVVGPDGRKVVVMSGTGGVTPVSGATLTFDQGAQAQLPVSGPLASGVFQPSDRGQTVFNPPAPADPYESGLDAWNGTEPNGEWRLFIEDNQGSGGGWVAGGWRLEIATAEPRLEIARAGNEVVVSWPGTWAGYSLQERGVLAGAGPWKAVSGAPLLVDGRWTVVLESSAGTRFFRLAKP